MRTLNHPSSVTLPLDDASKGHAMQLAVETLQIEADAISRLQQRLANDEASAFAEAMQFVLACSGKVVVSGIGKSGHIARKMAATFCFNRHPSFFVHPAEAAHGDLGMVSAGDVLIAISYSGERASWSPFCLSSKDLGSN